MSVVVVVVVVVVIVISASCAGYGVRSFFAKLFSLWHLNMEYTIILEYTFSQFQDKNISLTVRKKIYSCKH